MGKATSITRKIAYALSVLIFLEIVLLISAFVLGNVNTKMEENSYYAFNENVKNQTYNIESELSDTFVKISSAYSNIQKVILNHFTSSILLENATTEDKNDFFINNLPLLISLMKTIKITGIYLIFEDSEDILDQPHEGIYLKDSDISINYNDNSDIIGIVGDEEIFSNANITLDEQHTNEFFVNQAYHPNLIYNYYSFIDPTLAIEDQTDIKIFMNSYQLSNQTYSTLIFSLPIIINSEIVGVFGFDLDTSYFNYLFPLNNFTHIENCGYGFGILENNVLTTRFVNGGVIDKVEAISNITYDQTDYEQLYSINDKLILDNVYAVYNELNLNSDTVKVSKKWTLIAYVYESKLYESAHSVGRLMTLTIIITIFFGFLILHVVMKYIANPLRQLSAQVKSKEIGVLPILKKTNITELNDLISSIEGLSQDVYSYSQKLTNAIDIFSLGIFFYQESSEQIYCTQPFFDICGIAQKEGYCNKKDFESWLSTITNSPFNFDYSAYHLNNLKWIKVITKKEGLVNIGIVTDVTNQVNDLRKVEQERDIDSLTKLFNRQAFLKAAEKVFQTAENKSIAIIMWDIDKLKYINDTYGHEYGDRYIIKFSEIIKTLEEQNGIVCRRSGDEFIGLIIGNSQSEVIKIINSLRNHLNEEGIQINDKIFERIRVSAGVAWYPDDGYNLETLINYADYALYEVKYNYRGITSYYNKESFPNHSFLLHFSNELTKVIEGDYVTFAYQPIVEVKTGKIYGYEFLMRIFSEIINSPAKLMSIAKIESKQNEIENLTFRKSYSAYLDNLELIQERKIFINSFSSIVLDSKELSDLFQNYKDNLNMMVVEFTEYIHVSNDILKRKADIFHELQASVALDNCGTEGYNNLVLQKVKYDYLKVDLSVINDIDIDEQHQKVFYDIQKYAKENGCKVIAVGVKTYEELRYLIEAGVDYVQGYFIGMPAARPSEIDHEVLDIIKTLYENNKTQN